MRGSLEGLLLPGPLETLTLSLSGLSGESSHQESLFYDVRRRIHLEHAVRGQRTRMGQPPPIYQVQEVEPWSRIPERRVAR